MEVALHGAVATLVTDGKSFALLDLNAHIFRQGGACPENLALLVPVPLRPAEIAAILLGDAPAVARRRARWALAWDGKARGRRAGDREPRAAGRRWPNGCG